MTLTLQKEIAGFWHPVCISVVVLTSSQSNQCFTSPYLPLKGPPKWAPLSSIISMAQGRVNSSQHLSAKFSQWVEYLCSFSSGSGESQKNGIIKVPTCLPPLPLYASLLSGKPPVTRKRQVWPCKERQKVRKTSLPTRT